MRGRLGQRLDPLARTLDQGQRRPQLRGHVGAERRRQLLQVVDLASGESQDRGRVAAAAAEAGRDRHPLLDLDPQRRPLPAALAQRRRRPRRQVLALHPGGMTTSSRSDSVTAIRSARASGSNSEQSSCRPSSRRGPR